MTVSQRMPIRRGVSVRTQNVFMIAHELAAGLGHIEVTPVHMLLAMLRERKNPAVVSLYTRGVRLTELEDELEKHLPPATTAYEADFTWTDDDVALLDRAAHEARELGHEYQGCEHILLALLRDTESIPALVLAQHEVRLRDAQVEILRLLGSPRSGITDGPSPAV